MLFRFADNTRPHSMASRMRRKRLEWFNELLAPFPAPVRILDIGGTPGFWTRNRGALAKPCHLTLLNIKAANTEGLPDAEPLVGDARRLDQIADGAFDVVFSNSVIEHVGTLYDQRAMATEVRRVARAYFVQTPNRYFPLEPHFLIPGWQLLPMAFRAWLVRQRRCGWVPREPDRFRARAEVEQIRLLNAWEMRHLFPDATLRLERVGPLVKSITAVRPRTATP